ncbi:transglycosylase SLT domain-containing protein [bacterium]|nr:transglycosylase SLT domain-containing protein [bacterium]
MRLKNSLFTFVLLMSPALMAFGGRAPKEDSPDRSPGSVKEVRWEDEHSQGARWTAFVHDEMESLGKNLLATTPADIGEFCPNYSKLSRGNKKNFWTYLLSAMTEFESNFNPSLQYRENFKDSKGNYIISRGLLQLSQESANGYSCNIRDAQDLHNPFTNLSCAIRIIDRWVGRDKRIAGQVSGGWRGGARYWSVLRTSGHNRVTTIKRWTSSFCSEL